MDDSVVMDESLVIAAKDGDLVRFVEEARNNELESGCSEEYFLRQTSYYKENILHLAIAYQQNEFIEKVLEEGELLLPKAITDELIKQQDRDQNTPLHHAAWVGDVNILKLVLEYDVEQTKVKNRMGNTPLHVALIYGKDDNARLLLQQHHEVTTVTNNDGNTPLHLAVMYVNIHMARMLIEDPHLHKMTRAANNFNERPLHLAIKNYKQTISEWKRYTDYEQKYGTTNWLSTNARLWLEEKTKELNGITKLLLVKDSNVLCMRDKENMTPLYGAASLVPFFGVEVVNMISECCPKSVKEKDYLGRTILHYMIDYVTSYKTGKSLLQLPGINELWNYKDSAGNTPLDLAWKINIKMVRALLDSSSQQNIHDSISTYAVVQKTNDFEMIRKRRKTMDEYGVVDGVHLQFLKSKLSKFRNDFLFSRDSKGRNLLHHLMQLERGSPIDFEEFHDFILEVVDIQPKLVCQTDHNRETPVHILMRNSLHTKIRVNSESGKQIETLGNSRLVKKLIDLCCKYFHVAKRAKTKASFKYEPPWLVQNVDGNTPLHEAFKANHIGPIWDTLSKLEIETTAKLTNKHNETPLHLVAGCSFVECPKYVIVDLVRANPKAAFGRDENGLTPMMRAIQVGNISTFQILFDLYFGAGDQMVDNNNNNVDAQLYKDIKAAAINNINLAEEKDEIISGFVEKMAREKNGTKSSSNNVGDDTEIKADQYEFAKRLLTDNNGCTLWHVLLKQPASKAGKFVEDIEIKLLIQIMLEVADKEGVPQLIVRLKESKEKGKTLLELIELLKDGDKVEGKMHLMRLLNEADKQRKTLSQLIELLKKGEDKHGKKVLLNLIKLLNEAQYYFAKKLMTDNNGCTLWHMLLNQPPSKAGKLVQDIKNKLHLIELLEEEADKQGKTPSQSIELLKEGDKQRKIPLHLIELLKEKDKEGKTPLHLALERRLFKHAYYFLNWSCSLKGDQGLEKLKELLNEKDDDGNKPCDILASLTDFPKQLEIFFKDKYPQLIGYRSLYGISTSEMKDCVRTMGVIAALLTTITFTSAFTVPRKAIQDNKGENVIGTPIVVHKAAFQAFMFFDILTMCISTMILFCLLWILAPGSKSSSVMLMDFSILLLLISFHTTLLTFMTGVYATTIHVKPWIAIYTLVLCSSLMILFMFKPLVVRYLASWVHKIFLHFDDTRPIKWMTKVCSKFLSIFKLRKE